ncbi:cysteine dioxygenase type 1 [Schistocerca americana]|uniref:cysteine dioxygenase type 1 n=1 Tax=Schistocerca americana TaxID=7009 RepID=UPI001F4F1BB9|nr:cysteine dioxygenase type 1 [Schistocerca americana]
MERVARQHQQQQQHVVAHWRKAPQPLPAAGTLQELAQQLHAAFQHDSVNVEHVQALMEAYRSDPAHWKKFAKFDRYRYTRNLVDEGNGKFNLMILCWGEGHGSAIHDHADAHCFMKVLQGTLSEVRFAWPEKNIEEGDEIMDEDGGLKELSRTELGLNEVCYINDSLGLHRVENPSHTEPAVSLHLYCPPFDTCSVFNQRTGKRTQCKVTFWSKYGNKTSKDEQGHFIEDN